MFAKNIIFLEKKIAIQTRINASYKKKANIKEKTKL